MNALLRSVGLSLLVVAGSAMAVRACDRVVTPANRPCTPQRPPNMPPVIQAPAPRPVPPPPVEADGNTQDDTLSRINWDLPGDAKAAGAQGRDDTRRAAAPATGKPANRQTPPAVNETESAPQNPTQANRIEQAEATIRALQAQNRRLKTKLAAIHFGKDGKLFIAIGDQTAGKPAQDLQSLLGKLLRINPDGSFPEDNPFASKNAGKYRAIWALGLRNPFTFAVQAETGRLFINDVGGVAEEINEGVAGANYGWPTVEHGPTTDPRFRGPIHHYPTACVIGGAFAPKDLSWPKEYRGQYFFGDFNHGWIKTLDPAKPATAKSFATGLRRPVDLRFSPDGSLYVLVRDAWVIDKLFKESTGAMLRIRQIEP
jgi:glucose/arabinose dehydrogenase